MVFWPAALSCALRAAMPSLCNFLKSSPDVVMLTFDNFSCTALRSFGVQSGLTAWSTWQSVKTGTRPPKEPAPEAGASITVPEAAAGDGATAAAAAEVGACGFKKPFFSCSGRFCISNICGPPSTSAFPSPSPPPPPPPLLGCTADEAASCCLRRAWSGCAEVPAARRSGCAEVETAVPGFEGTLGRSPAPAANSENLLWGALGALGLLSLGLVRVSSRSRLSRAASCCAASVS
mmetsp:Transcript_71630/g.180774  ORF Transcript_71630/g.180774 Transcript_71630/m.180774 type:complete len:234 (-) Transcript_71630:63-764(-)